VKDFSEEAFAGQLLKKCPTSPQEKYRIIILASGLVETETAPLGALQFF